LHLSKIEILFPVSLTTEYKINADYLYLSSGFFVTIHGKSPELQNWNSGHLHTSNIGNLLPVCLRKNRLQNNQISERHAKFGENR